MHVTHDPNPLEHVVAKLVVSLIHRGTKHITITQSNDQSVVAIEIGNMARYVLVRLDGEILVIDLWGSDTK